MGFPRLLLCDNFPIGQLRPLSKPRCPGCQISGDGVFLAESTRGLDGKRRRSNLDRLSAYPRSGARLDDPLSPAPKQLGVLHYVEEPALSDQLLEIGTVVSAEFLVFEVYPEPFLRAAVIDIKRTRFWISWSGKE